MSYTPEAGPSVGATLSRLGRDLPRDGMMVAPVWSPFDKDMCIAYDVGMSIADMRKPGRPLQWPEAALTKFSEGTFSRIAELLQTGETRRDFIRQAVTREIGRRKGSE